MPNQYEVSATYQQDSKRFHRFEIEDETGKVVGSIYCAKGEPVPEQLVVKLGSIGDRLNR